MTSHSLYFLYLRNVLCFEEVTLNLANNGLVGVFGENKDLTTVESNGSGKSSFLEAIYWVLFGKSLKGLAASEIVRWDSTGGACGQIRFIGIAGSHFEVSRYRDDSKEGNGLILKEKTGEDWVLVKGQDKKEINQKIQEEIGMTPELFLQVVLLGRSSKFSELGDSGQKKLLEEVLGLSVYDTAASRARKRSSKIKEAIKFSDSALSNGRDLLSSLSDVLASSTDLRKKWFADIEKAKKRNIDLLAECRAELELLENKVKEGDETRVGPRVGPLDRDKFLIANETLRDGKKEELLKRGEEEEKRKSISEKSRIFSTKKQRIEKAYWDKKNELNGSMSGLLARITHFEQDKSRLERFVKERKCPTCDQVLLTDSPDTGSASMLLEATANLEKEIEKKNECERRLAGLELAMAEQNRILDEEKILIDTEMKEVLLAISLIDTEIKTVDAAIQSNNDILEQMARAEDKERRLLSDIEAKREQIETLEIKLLSFDEDLEYPYEARIVQHREKHAKQVKIVSDIESRYNELSCLKNQYDVLAKVFGPRGIRSFLFESVLPELNKSVAKYAKIATGGQMSASFSAFSSSVKGDVREEISIKVWTPQRITSYKARSNGEQGRLDLPFALALQDICARRGIGLGLCFFDEVFDHMDGPGCEGVLQVLQIASQRSHTSSIYVIAHIEELSSRFTRWLRIKKYREITTAHLFPTKRENSLELSSSLFS